MSNLIKKEMEVAGKKLSFETGIFAPLCNIAVLARYGDSVVLVTVVAKKQGLGDSAEFFPLKVDYQEKLYAGGRIKSSRFVKREGRPSDDATITARLIDHAIRPLFPKDFMDEVQVVATALSVDNEGDAEVLAMLGVSAALTASDIPWYGPMVTSRLGVSEDGSFLINPSSEHMEKSPLDMVISTVKGDKLLAIEAGVNILPEEKILQAFEFANDQNKKVLGFIQEFADAVGSKKYDYVSMKVSHEIVEEVEEFCGKRIAEYVAAPLDKKQAEGVIEEIKEDIYKEFVGKYTKPFLAQAFDEIEKKEVRKLVLEKKQRPDGRKIDEIRPIDMMLSLLPRTHGSAFFRRGLTQALSITTLGSSSLEQLIQNMYGEETKKYMHHYYGPAYSLGETGQIGNPGRREIGHGALAEKALLPVIPSRDVFPYAIRVVSEILSQNGSSSMAATCGSTLSLMDAGVPIKAPVAGIGVGLIANADETEFILLTDMAGIEDFNGFMDFKMTGTKDGVTAIQMDIKLKGVPLNLMKEVLARSKKARLEVLDLIDKAISSPRSELSKYAPKVDQVKVKADQIGLIIGAGGRTIKDIMSKTKTTVDVNENDDGSAYVSIAGTDIEGVKKAKTIIENLIREVKVGEIYDAVVKRVAEFGAIVEIFPGKEGLMHVSEISHSFVDDPTKLFKIGDVVKVKVVNVERDGKISLSKKALEAGGNSTEGMGERPRRPMHRPNSPMGGMGSSRGGFGGGMPSYYNKFRTPSGGSGGGRGRSPREGSGGGRGGYRGDR